MPNEKFYVTKEGYNDLVKEHEELVHKTRAEVIVELQEARAQGDLSENADYDAAREHQAQVEARIRELEALIKNSEIIEYSEKVTDVLPHLSWGHSFEVIGNIHEVEQ